MAILQIWPLLVLTNKQGDNPTMLYLVLNGGNMGDGQNLGVHSTPVRISEIAPPEIFGSGSRQRNNYWIMQQTVSRTYKNMMFLKVNHELIWGLPS